MRGVCVSLARRGYAVAANYRPPRAHADETQAAIRAAGGEADAFSADVSRPEQATSLVEWAVSRFGRLDALVCGAGPMLRKDASDTTDEEWRAMIDGNLSSVFFCARAALPHMRAQHRGRIIGFGMTGSDTTMGARHLAAHAAAKAGLVSFLKSLSLEEGPFGITCNAICIGDIRDKDADRTAAAERRAYRNPMTRPGSWEDVGDAVCWLASDEASFVNGAVLNVNGGWQGFFADYSRWP